jgi:hypothetical protein
LTFGQAIILLKEGKCVARHGWNGKDMFLWLKNPVIIRREWSKDELLKKIIASFGEKSIEGLGTVCMKTADNKVLTGWLASQTDMLSEDWEEVDFEEQNRD